MLSNEKPSLAVRQRGFFLWDVEAYFKEKYALTLTLFQLDLFIILVVKLEGSDGEVIVRLNL